MIHGLGTASGPGLGHLSGVGGFFGSGSTLLVGPEGAVDDYMMQDWGVKTNTRDLAWDTGWMVLPGPVMTTGSWLWACLVVQMEISGWQMDTGVWSCRKSDLELNLKFSAGGRAEVSTKGDSALAGQQGLRWCYSSLCSKEIVEPWTRVGLGHMQKPH